MKISTKAVLLSALVFPGAGHLFLRRYLVGGILAGTAAIALYLLISHAVATALEAVKQIQAGTVPATVAGITEFISKAPTGAEALTIDIASALVVIVWVLAILDAYRIGRLT